MRARRYLLLVALVAVAVTAVSSPAARAATGQTYLGRLDGIGLPIAVVTDGPRALAYVVEREGGAWLSGTVTGGAVLLVADDGAGRLQAQISGTAMHGTVRWHGASTSFTAIAPDGDGPAGLYTGQAGDIRATWVLLPDGSGDGAVMDGSDEAAAPDVVLPASSVASGPRGTLPAGVSAQSLFLVGPSYQLTLARLLTVP